jgi:hypothetical protein
MLDEPRAAAKSCYARIYCVLPVAVQTKNSTVEVSP